jgi:hypothetical protein
LDKLKNLETNNLEDSLADKEYNNDELLDAIKEKMAILDHENE